ncbi:MAG: sulfite exporter TauE/SafE family protein [Deltaproteobacteria bacterium]|nr:sulfite exporter TauE/SafE family protein [Deltaproteobacteria bacterium]
MPQTYLIALIFLAAGFTQGLSGFGSALVAMPLLLLFLDAKTAVPLCVLNGLVITAFLSLQLRSHVDWRKIIPPLIGCLPGIYVGDFLLRKADGSLIKLLLGVLLIGYALYCMFLQPKPRKIASFWPYVAGFFTGLIGSAFSAGGPPTIIYTTLTGWNKDAIKATLSVFFFTTGIFIAVAHAMSGLTTPVVLRYFFLSAGFVLFGVMAGSFCYGRVERETYLKIILNLLVIMGGMMIFSAL